MERIFLSPNRDDSKNQLLLQLRSCLVENRVDQIFIRFVFTGDLEEAERSQVLDKLREDLENKKYLINQFFGDRDVRLIVDFRSSTGRIGSLSTPTHSAVFTIPLTEHVLVDGPEGQQMHIGFVRIVDLHHIHASAVEAHREIPLFFSTLSRVSNASCGKTMQFTCRLSPSPSEMLSISSRLTREYTITLRNFSAEPSNRAS